MNVLAFTGAGISKPSGIPTYEDMPHIKKFLCRDFANNEPEFFENVLKNVRSRFEGKVPNDAHKVLAEHDIQVVTMNIDNLHEQAGSKNVLHIHGSIEEGDVVLYGDKYDPNKMMKLDDYLVKSDVILIVGTAYQVEIAVMVKEYATNHPNGDFQVFEINENAETELRKIVENLV